MKEDIARRWVEALRSDRFTRTTGKLVQVVDGKVCHCGNGVLMELAVEDGIINRVGPANNPRGYADLDNPAGYCAENATLLNSVRKWSGYNTISVDKELADAFPQLNTFMTENVSVTLLNDGLDWPLDKIADYLEYRLNKGTL